MGRVVLRAEGDVFPTATAHRVGGDRHVDSALLDCADLGLRHDGHGLDDGSVPSSSKMRAAISLARSTSKPSMSPVFELREENPSVFSSTPTQQASALTDLVERAPVGRSVVGSEALRRELLLDALALAGRRRRCGCGRRSACLGDGRVRHCARGERREPLRCPNAVGSEQAPSVARRRQANGAVRISGTPAVSVAAR